MYADWSTHDFFTKFRYTEESAEEHLRERINRVEFRKGLLADIVWDFGEAPPVYRLWNLSRGLDDTCALGMYYINVESREAYPVVLRVVPSPDLLAPYRRHPAELPPRVSEAFEQFIKHGVGLGGHVALSYYLFGSDLGKLADAGGVSITWTAAMLLHAAITAPLRELHALGYVHGAITARRIRLCFLPTPDHNKVVPATPVRFIAPRFESATPEGIRRDLHAVAAAVMKLTTHPVPEVQAMLEDRTAMPVLRDSLLEAEGEPVEQLLSDFVGVDLEAGLNRATQQDMDDLRLVWFAAAWEDSMIKRPLEV